jgi:hypothetical protein
MGLYARVPNITQGSRPVYRSVKAKYLYYLPTNGQWAIGPDYTSDTIGARSTGAAVCPDAATGWQVYNGAWTPSSLAFFGAVPIPLASDKMR